jgi:beta-phosphoglucomutase-like phosphatase (HAD superfamily)
MPSYSGFIFDMNGTMINDMEYHIRVWRDVVIRLGGSISIDEMKAQCYGKNSEMLERIFPARFTDAEKLALESEKEALYRKEYAPFLVPIGGLPAFLQKASENGIRMGLGTAGIRLNADFVLDGLGIRSYFSSLVCSEDVRRSKPDPETFLLCAEKMGLPPEKCVVFEDSPRGVETAANAGMHCVVITSMHTADEFRSFGNILFFIDDYSDPQLGRL